MKNIILLISFIIVMGVSIAFEPVTDTIDVIAGATNTTYNISIDQISGASRPHGDDDDDDDRYEPEDDD